jgi:hypothetical protein
MQLPTLASRHRIGKFSARKGKIHNKINKLNGDQGGN